MSDDGDIGTDWLPEATADLAGLRGASRVPAIYQIARRLGAEERVADQIKWLSTGIEEAHEQARFDYMFQSFGDLRAIYGRRADDADLQSSILWYFKWVLSVLADHADVSREMIETMFSSAEQFYRECGESPRPLWGIRCTQAIEMGLPSEEIEEWYARWESAPRGQSDDCEACEIDTQILYRLSKTDADGALEVVKPILRGDAGCAFTPYTLSRLLVPAHIAGQGTLAYRIHRWIVRDVRKQPQMLTALANHVRLLAIAGDTTRALRLTLKTLATAKQNAADYPRYHAYTASAMAIAIYIVLRQSVPEIPARLCPGELGDAAGGVPGAIVVERCIDAAHALAVRLDARNQTSKFCKGIADTQMLIRRAAEGDEDSSGRLGE